MKTFKRYLRENTTIPLVFLILALIVWVGAFIAHYYHPEDYLYYGAAGLNLLLIGLAITFYIRGTKKVDIEIKKSLDDVSCIAAALDEGILETTKHDISIKEVKKMQELVDAAISNFKYKAYQEVDHSRDEIELEYDEKTKLLVFNSFTKYVRQLLTKASLYRAAVINVQMIGGENEKFFGELIVETKKVFNTEVIGLIKTNHLGVYIDNVTSLVLLKKTCERLIREFQRIETTKEDKLINYHVNIGCAIYPYSSGADIFHDAQRAQERAVPFSMYVHKARIDAIETSLEKDGERHKYIRSLLLLEKLASGLKSLKSIENYLDYIKESIVAICKFVHFDNAGYFLFDLERKNFKTEFEFSTRDEFDTFKLFGVFPKEKIETYFTFFDSDHSFYGAAEKDIPFEIRSLFDNFKMTFFYHSLIFRNGKVEGMLYFNGFEDKKAFSNTEKEILLAYSSIIAQMINSFLSIKEEARKHLMLNSLLKRDEKHVYMVSQDTMQITYFSDPLKNIYPRMEVGAVCYKVFNDNQTAPCAFCPLSHGKGNASRPEIGPEVQISVLNYLSANQIEAAIIMEKYQGQLQSVNQSEIDPVLHIRNKLGLRTDLAYEFNSKKTGYLSFIEISNYKALFDTRALESARHIMDVLSKRIQSLGLEDSLYLYRDGVFGILLKQATRPEVLEMIDKVYTVISRPVNSELGEETFDYNASIIAYPTHITELGIMDRTIRQALQESLDLGNNQLYIYGEKGGRKLNRQAYVLDVIDEAIKKEKFEIYLQPILKKGGKENFGAEVLLRLFDPSRGFIPPNEFVPIASEKGRMFGIEQSVLQQVGKLWKTYGFTIFKQARFSQITLNISLDSLLRDDFASSVIATCSKFKFPKNFLQFEVNESIIKTHFDRLQQIMKDLESANISWSIDNFGTSKTTIEDITKLRVNKIKLDRSFIIDIENNNRALISLSYIVDMAKNRGYEIAVEGIERKEQLDAISGLEFDSMQGFYFEKPMPVNNFIKYLNFGK